MLNIIPIFNQLATAIMPQFIYSNSLVLMSYSQLLQAPACYAPYYCYAIVLLFDLLYAQYYSHSVPSLYDYYITKVIQFYKNMLISVSTNQLMNDHFVVTSHSFMFVQLYMQLYPSHYASIICLMLSVTQYAQNYANIISLGLHNMHIYSYSTIKIK